VGGCLAIGIGCNLVLCHLKRENPWPTGRIPW
jgi:hypothetical protein